MTRRPVPLRRGVEQRIAEALKRSLPSVAEVSKDPPQGLHVGYKQDFFHRGTVPMVPALSSTALSDLLKAMDRLRLQVPSVPNEARPLLDGETLLDKIEPGSKKSDDEEVVIHLMSQLLNTFDRAPKVKGVKGRYTLPNKAARLGGSIDVPGIGGPSNRTTIWHPSVPPGQVVLAGKAPSQPLAAGSRKRRIESLKADMTKKMGQLPQIVDGVTINHDKDSILATFSMSKNRASKPTQSLDDEVEGQDDPPRKVTKVTFASDDDLGSPLAKSKMDTSEPQGKGGEPDGEEDPDEEPDEEDGEGELPDGAGGVGGNPEEFEEDEESSSGSGDEEEDDMLEDPKENLGPNEDPDLITNRLQTRINLYSGTKMIAKRV